MGNTLCLNKLSDVDAAFFIVCAVIIALIVAVYFLIPVINKKLYQEQRDNLHKREASFKSNLQTSNSAEAENEDAKTENAENPEASSDE